MRARHAEWVKNSYEKKIYQDYLEEIKHDAKKDSRLRKKSNRKLARSVLQLAQDVLNKTLDSDGDNKKLKALTTALSNTKHSDQSLITYLNTLPQKDTLIKDTLIKDNTLTFKGKHCRDILVETLCMPVPHNDAHAATAEKTRQPLTAVDISTIKNRLSSDDDTKLMHFLAKQNSNITLVESSLNLLTYQFKVTDDPNSHPTTTQKIGDHYTVIDNTDHSGDKQALVKDYQHLILSMITFDYYQHQNGNNPCPLLNLNIKINEQHQQGPHKDAIENAIKETLKTFAEKNNISVAYQGETPINPLPYQRYNHEPLREFCSKHPKIIREKNEKKILKDALKTLSNSSTPSEYQDITIDQQTVTLSLDGDNLKITVGKQSETVSKDLKAQEVLKKIKSIILEESKKHTNYTQSK